jgi:choline kinase
LKLDARRRASSASSSTRASPPAQTGIEHEEVYPDLLARAEVGFERVDGTPWTEIDFPEDVTRAEREILPRIEAG